ncbi:MAG: DUF2117 domain-containing protein [Candidatus Methanoperedens sp.]|nr:DUF2117 domain-containing protein [Candidatus Methanoperedens sp.]MCZ7369050.1 DUF2117 domain-containing protein [Candidatus Methanoperedens sp.]
MRIGIVLHGPEIVDVGSAKKIIDIFKRDHNVIAKLGGTMGRTAVLDAELEDVIDISQGLTPSETINDLAHCIDLAILLNHGKTLETGRHFGRLVASKLKPSIPFIHIERPDSSGRVFYHDSRARYCAEYARKILHDGNYDLTVEKESITPLYVRAEGNTIVRRICGAFPGENIRLDGIVIGEVTGQDPEIVCRDGQVVELRAGKIKPHGIEKLKNRSTDLFTARVKTGYIRRTRHSPRIKEVPRRISESVAVIIDHCAESTFELIRDANLVITIGDDTTSIASDILTRFGIPVIGITDGDLDCILEDAAVPAGSVIIRVREGFDDIVGKKLSENLMEGRQKISMQGDELTARILALAEKYIVEVKYY